MKLSEVMRIVRVVDHPVCIYLYIVENAGINFKRHCRYKSYTTVLLQYYRDLVCRLFIHKYKTDRFKFCVFFHFLFLFFIYNIT